MFKKKSLFILLLFTSVMLLSSCSKIKDPVQVFNEFSESWSSEDFATLYTIMDSSTKEKLSEEDFIAKNEEFFETAFVDNLQITTDITYEEIEKDIKDNTEIIIPFSLKVSTSYGDFSVHSNAKLIKEEIDKNQQWNIVWNNTYFLSDYTDKETSISSKVLTPERGSIYDRSDELLAGYGDVVRVLIVPGRFNNNKEDVIATLAQEFNLTNEFIEGKLNQSWVKDDLKVPIINIPSSEISRIEKINLKFLNDDGKSPATYDTIKGRVYPLGESAAHLTGYIGMITAEELEKHTDDGYTAQDYIGKTGLELLYEEELRGKNGIQISLDIGDNSTELLKKEATDGQNIKLTIDSDLQQKQFTQFGEDAGTATTINYKTGEILALTSSPSYDPNKFISGMSNEEYNELKENPKLPFINRFSIVYAPGSTFKAITGAIALETGVAKPEDSINIDGFTWQKDSSWGNYYITRVTDPKTPVDMEKAFIYSDNIFFAQLALKIGEKNFSDYAKKFGIGEPLNIGYSINSSQLISDPNSAIKDTLLADTGYGQGEVQVNPLYLSKAYTAFVNEGQVIEPTLLYNEVSSKETSTTSISPDVASTIYNYLLKVVEDTHGTAHQAKIAGREIAGKTGTAELKSSKDDTAASENGWFIAIENSTNTPYITTMMIEDVKDRGGSHYVVPKVKSFIQSY